ncbi:hypothetical protein A6R68_03462, partial [Neotoma lepida]
MVQRKVVSYVKMKLNIAFPATSSQKLTEVTDIYKVLTFYEKHTAREIAADA